MSQHDPLTGATASSDEVARSSSTREWARQTVAARAACESAASVALASALGGDHEAATGETADGPLAGDGTLRIRGAAVDEHLAEIRSLRAEARLGRLTAQLAARRYGRIERRMQRMLDRLEERPAGRAAG